MIDFVKGLDAYGRLSNEKLFIENFKKPARKIGITFDRAINLSEVDHDALLKQFPECQALESGTTLRYSEDMFEKLKMRYDENGKAEEGLEDHMYYDDEGNIACYFGDTRISGDLSLYFNDFFLYIGGNSATVWYQEDYTKPLDTLNKIVTTLPKIVKKPKSLEIGIIGLTNGDYYVTNRPISTMDVNIKKQYNDDFKDVYKKIVDFISPDHVGSGVVLLNGKPGCGKSSLLRKLIRECPAQYIYITPAIAAHLSEPELTTFLLDNQDSVFILEDCEQVIMDRENNAFGTAIASLLNMSDGLMSDIFNGKFICTYNTSTDKIDSALLRKGRCITHYEFKPLEEKKSAALLKELYKLSADEAAEIAKDGMTLADIYNYSPDEVNEEPKKKSKRKLGI